MYVQHLGLEKLTSAFGIATMIMGMFSMMGSPIAGLVYSATGNFKYPFLVCSISYLIAGTLLFLVEYIRKSEKDKLKKRNKR